MTSSIVERTIRICDATRKNPKETAGMIIPFQPRRSIPPALGSHPSWTLNSRMSSRPTQKTGIDWPVMATTFPTRSKSELGLEAEIAPIKTPITTAMIIAALVSCKVAGIRSQTTSTVGRLSQARAFPRSP